ncbi:MAG: tetratricopeptide repeat protein [Phycisphaerae bacterium]|nr:tetratricopeptide repeat protein [Phycisphaerae bacterium]
MKKRNFTILACVFLLAIFAEFCSAQRLANFRLQGRYVNSIEQVLSLEPDEVDLATAVIIISEQWSEDVQGRGYLEKLDQMASEIIDRLDDRGIRKNYKAIQVINEYLFDEMKFDSVDNADDPEDLFLPSVMDNRVGYCLSLSVLYLGLCERVGLEVYGVVVPGHFFVRYDDGRVQVNIETTSKGGYAEDSHYIKKFKVPLSSNNLYLKNLNKTQTLGCYFNNLGNSYRDVGDVESAREALEIAVELNPDLSESRANLGNIYLDKDLINEAIDQYKLAMLINPGDSKTHNNLGNAYSKKDWLHEAIAEYKMAIELDANFVDAYKNLAVVYAKRKMYREGLRQIKKAIELAGDDADIYLRMANIYSQIKEYNNAIAAYEKAIELKADLADAYFGLGVCYGRKGDSDKQIEAYKNALRIKPDMVEALGNLGNVYFSLEELDLAIIQYKRAVAMEPRNKDMRYNLAAAYSNSKQYEEALAQYLAVLKIDPEMDDCYSGLAFVFYKLRDFERAMEYAKKAMNKGQQLPEGLIEAIEAQL